MWGPTLVALAALAVPALAQGATCDALNPCPASAPCCSPYGFCGREGSNFCLGGCEPLHSFQLTSCKPNPVCKNLHTDFNDLSRVLMNGTRYDGNATAYDWIVDKGTIEPSPLGDGARLILTEANGGTKISSTRYVHYGMIDFEMETSQWGGVVTAAITMSDVKDEIDFEWPGAVTNQVQSNFFQMGHVNYSDSNGGYHNISGNMATSFHTYTINWTPDQLEWWVDGIVVRTVKKVDTWKEQHQRYMYPTTPSRVQISIWPAGIDGAAEGTLAWAGGMINWADKDYVENGHFWNTIKSINIACNDDLVITPDATGYQFTGNDSYSVPMVGITNRSTGNWKSSAPALQVGTGVGVSLALALFMAFPAMAWVM